MAFRQWGWLLLLLAVTAAGQTAEEGIWDDFLAWLPQAPASDHPGTLISAYREHLARKGLTEADIGRQQKIILQMMRTRDDGWRQIFNKIYTGDGAGYSKKPNRLLVSAVEGRKPGRALDAGMGQGRNAVFLAIKGWDVTGFDVSEDGIAQALKSAAQAGVSINAVNANNKDFDYGISQWDLIVITYEPFPVTDPAYIEKLNRALRPGGLLVVESFASAESAQGRRAVDIDPEKLLRALSKFRIRRFEDTEDVADWTLERTPLVRAIAEKR